MIIPVGPQFLLSGGSAGGLASYYLSEGDLKIGHMSMIGLNPVTRRVVISELVLQYWPEQIQDDIEIVYVPKDIPGASHSLMQYSHNGGRTFTLSFPVVRQMEYAENLEGGFLKANPTNEANRPRNVDVKNYLRKLRLFTTPIIEQGEVIGPPVIVLYAPNLGWNESGSDTIFGVVTAMPITYVKLFKDGKPKVANVEMTIKQVVQIGDENPNFKYFSDVDLREDVINPHLGTGIDPNESP